MPWAVAGAAIGAGATLYGSSQQSSAVKAGADQSAAVQREGIAFQREALGQLRSDLAPYTAAGVPALGGMQDAAGLNGQAGYDNAVANFHQSPGYNFAFNEGMRATNNAMAAQGLSNSGAALKALQARGQGLADQEFGQYYNRLAGLAQIGQNSAAMSGNAGIQTANGVANGLAGIGQTYASAAGAQAGITGNMVSGVSGAINNGLNNYLYANGGTNSLYSPRAASTVGIY